MCNRNLAWFAVHESFQLANLRPKLFEMRLFHDFHDIPPASSVVAVAKFGMVGERTDICRPVFVRNHNHRYWRPAP